MINQTELHRLRVDAGGITAGHAIRQALNLQMDDILQLKHQSGLAFIELNAVCPKYDIELLEMSRAFWTWWCRVWYMTDMKLYEDGFSVKCYHIAHTRITDIRVVDSFKKQYKHFINSGIDASIQGGQYE